MLMRPDDLLSFSSGCFEVTRALIDLAGQGYDCLLIPCRDAFPILAGAIQALKTVEGGTKFLERFYAPYSHPMLEETQRKRGDFKLLVPSFTAHANLLEAIKI